MSQFVTLLLWTIWMRAVFCSPFESTRILDSAKGDRYHQGYAGKQCHADGDSCLRGNTCCNAKAACMPRTARCEVCSALGERCDSTKAGCCWKLSFLRSEGGLMCGGDGTCIDADNCLPIGGTGCSKSCCAAGGLMYTVACVNDMCTATARTGAACDPGNKSIVCKAGTSCRNGVCKDDAKKDACSAMAGNVGCYENCLIGSCRMACDFKTMMCAEPVGDCKVTRGACGKDHSKCCDGYHCYPRGGRGPFCAPCEGNAMANGAGGASCSDAYSIEGCKKCGGSCQGRRCILPKAKPKPVATVDEQGPSDAGDSSNQGKAEDVPETGDDPEDDDEAAFAWYWDALQNGGDDDGGGSTQNGEAPSQQDGAASGDQ